MEKEFVSYNQALRLKLLGFDEPCLKTMLDFDITYESDVKMPLYQQAFRWFREKYPDLDFGVGKIYNGSNNYHYHINLAWEFFEGTYEEAELACLEKLIEIVETKSE